MRVGRSESGRKWALRFAAFWGALKFAYEVFEFVVGKIGWLGIFTSPEDFQTMLDRGPKWVAALAGKLQPLTYAFWEWADYGWRLAVSYEALLAVLVMITLLLLLDVDRILGWVSFLKYKARRVVSERVWIGEDAALDLLRESDWGKLITPTRTTTTGIFDSIAGIGSKTTIYGLSENQKNKLKLKIYFKKTLDSFEIENPNMVRNLDGEKQFDETGIRRLIDVLLDREIKSEFGNIPSVKLD